jgi:hypothetical protein
MCNWFNIGPEHVGQAVNAAHRLTDLVIQLFWALGIRIRISSRRIFDESQTTRSARDSIPWEGAREFPSFGFRDEVQPANDQCSCPKSRAIPPRDQSKSNETEIIVIGTTTALRQAGNLDHVNNAEEKKAVYGLLSLPCLQPW